MNALYRFVDRDVFMRFLGIRIGHCSQHTTAGAEPVDGDDSDNDSWMNLKVMTGLIRTWQMMMIRTHGTVTMKILTRRKRLTTTLGMMTCSRF